MKGFFVSKTGKMIEIRIMNMFRFFILWRNIFSVFLFWTLSRVYIFKIFDYLWNLKSIYFLLWIIKNWKIWKIAWKINGHPNFVVMIKFESSAKSWHVDRPIRKRFSPVQHSWTKSQQLDRPNRPIPEFIFLVLRYLLQIFEFFSFKKRNIESCQVAEMFKSWLTSSKYRNMDTFSNVIDRSEIYLIESLAGWITPNFGLQ